MFRRKYYEVWYDVTDFRNVTKTDRGGAGSAFPLTRKEAMAFAAARDKEDEFSNIRVVRVRKRVVKRYE